MNSLLNSILRSESLEKNIKILQQELNSKECELKKIQAECTHSIVVVSEIVSSGHSIKAECLFCKKTFCTPHELRELPSKESILGVYSFKQFKDVSNRIIYQTVTEKAKEILKKEGNISEKQLLEKLTKLLQKDEENFYANLFKNYL